MKDSGLKPEQIDKVLLVGGSTRIPAVQDAVRNFIGKDPFKGINPDEVVGVGAAIQAGVLSGEVTDVVLLDVTPLSLGIETLGGVFTRIIERNTTIPVGKSQVFTTAADSQTSVDIHVLQGERKLAGHNVTLGRFQLTGIPPAPRNVPQIEVKFDIDVNGIVHVTAKDLATQKEQRITITSSGGLNDDEIKRMMEDAERFADDDEQRLKEIEIRNAADSMIYQAEKTLKEYADQIDSEDKEKIENAKAELSQALEGSELELIEAKSEALTEAIFGFTAKMYEKANPEGSGANDTFDADYNIPEDDK